MATLKYLDVKPEKMTFTKFKGFTLVRYTNNNLIIQSPWINLYAYGIPRKDKYTQTENSRKYIKVPLDPEDPEVNTFINMLKAIDSRMVTSEIKEEILDNNHEKYEYSSMFKESQTPGRPSYLKLKLNTSNDEDQVIKTNLYQTSDDNKREEVTGVTNIDDFAKVVSFKSNIRFIFRIVRCWSQAPNLKNPGYGLTLKVTKIEVKGKSESTEFNNGDFIDDDAIAVEKGVAKYELASDGSDDEDEYCKKVNSSLAKEAESDSIQA
jgi:hypothetical protein